MPVPRIFRTDHCGLYAPVDTFHFRSNGSIPADSLFSFAIRFNLLIVSIHTDDIRSGRDFAVPDILLENG